jgi:hypothetical protein
MSWSNVPRRLLVVGAAAAVILGTGFVGKTYLVSPAYAACQGANPGNNKPVGNAGEHPPGGGGNSITGDRGGSR